jgi:oligopeptide/dipeptide ABC transporter ATP-binding protein
MYLGRIVEMGTVDELYGDTKHPYTAALLSAVPKGELDGGRPKRIVLTGDVPSPVDPPSGCPFHPRCPKARQVSGSPEEVPENCRDEMPPLEPEGRSHRAACWYPLAADDELRRATGV